MSTEHNGSGKSPTAFDQEVRFAIVMYGGASLAIYINGVAQELLRLVRATAPEPGGAGSPGRTHLSEGQLRASERVYRRLGRMLSRQGRPAAVPRAPGGGEQQPPVRTRFVVDILTGTSAGGINAVFLAKALANDQDMDDLKQLWIKEGDIGALVNDAQSYEQLKFNLGDDPGEPWSLLNSRRMYLKLLEALRGMEARPPCPTGQSPLADELDLYVTATDMAGRVLQLRLADKVVSEYRHRNVFQFRYRSQRASNIIRNDFGPEFNSFLAFAARATSAHQAAFSPVNLDDAARIVTKYELKGELPPTSQELRAFYQDYLLQQCEAGGAPPDAETLAATFSRLWFVDGGTLDNKPFSFVIEQLPLRHADTFVDRKLLYIEPSPEHLKRLKEQKKERPRIAGNAVAALTSLPRYETIVEDLTRLLERNRLVERLDRIMRGMEQDLSYGVRPKEPRTREQLREMIKNKSELQAYVLAKGAGWGSYQRLRVAEVTDDMTTLVARAAGFSEESDEYFSIRHLVREWRDARYDPHMEGDKRSQLEFLLDFDLLWVMRRIRFVIKKLDDLACMDKRAQEIARAPHGKDATQVWPDGEAEKAQLGRALNRTREELSAALVNLRGARRRLWAREDSNPFRPAIAALELTSKDLLDILHEPTDADRSKVAEGLLKTELRRQPQGSPLRTRQDAVQALTEQVKEELRKVVEAARAKCSDALRPGAGEAAGSRDWDAFVRQTLWYFYVYFDEFDQVSYPILYSTGVGEEADVIDVFRVSPEDATALIDETRPVNEAGQPVTNGGSGRSVHKLAGTTLGNFGAFFRDTFRVNDIMWGRLDGAERVIATLLPAHNDLREEMTAQAHRAILVEERLFADPAAAADKELQGAVWDALDVWDDVERRAELLNAAARRLPEGSDFRAHLERLSRGDEPCTLFRKEFIEKYDEGRRFKEDATIDTALRANRVLNGMALGYFPAENGGSKKRRAAEWVGSRFRIFVEAALQPDGKARRVQRLKLAAAYVVSALIIIFLCLPASVLMFWTAWPWPSLGFLLILLLTFLFAVVPLLVTAGYNLAWLKLKDVLTKHLRGATRG